ncbi:hypothetical protein MTO96_011507 [Rhipicephalus appendiculatus]
MELYDEEQFHARYRFTKHAMRELLAMLPLRSLMALRFYGAGTFQTVTGDLVGIPQSTVCRAFGKVTLLIAKHLHSMMVRIPQSAEFHKVMRDFYEVAEFPGVTRCIDCTHVCIKSPGGEDAEEFRNRKGYFSFNLQKRWVAFPETTDAKERTKAALARLVRIPGVLGCVGGTLIAIQMPHGLSPAHTANYMLRKGFCVLNTMIICDADFWILDDNLFPLVMSRLVGVAEELSSCTWIQNCGLVNTCLKGWHINSSDLYITRLFQPVLPPFYFKIFEN